MEDLHAIRIEVVVLTSGSRHRSCCRKRYFYIHIEGYKSEYRKGARMGAQPQKWCIAYEMGGLVTGGMGIYVIVRHFLRPRKYKKPGCGT